MTANTSIEIKTDKWLCATDLSRYIIGHPQKVFIAMQEQMQYMPHAIKLMKNRGRITVFLNQDFIDEFCQRANLVQRNKKQCPDKNWLNADHARKYIIGDAAKIRQVFIQQKENMPYAFQEFLTSRGKVLFLNREYIDELCEKTYLQRRNNTKTDVPHNKNEKSKKIRKANCYQETKGDDWLTPYEFPKNIIAVPSVIRKALIELQPQMPYAIQYKKNLTRITICLHRNYLDEFFVKSGIQKCHIADEQDQTWLRISDLQKYFIVGTKELAEAIKHAYTYMPHAITKVKTDGSRSGLRLHKDYLDEFAKFTKLKKRTDFELATPEWLTVHEMRPMVSATDSHLYKKIKELHPIMPHAIKELTRDGRITLFIHKDHLVEFCERSGIKHQKDNPHKCKDWINAREAKEFITGDAIKIRKAMQAIKYEMPYAFQESNFYGTPAIYLNKSYIDEFCQKTGLKQKKMKINKTRAWLDAKELNQIIYASEQKIQKALLSSKQTMPEKIQIKSISEKKSALCLRRDALNDFCVLNHITKRQSGKLAKQKIAEIMQKQR